MAVTSYYSVDGTILGEETGGTRRDYLTDALGSVTGTVTAAGAIENTYRYKPYGDQLSKTGAGSDPKFLWVGSKGYRSNQNNYYVRARHYTQKYATWSSQDPLGYVGGTNLYVYSDNNPSTFIDPSGQLTMIVETPAYGFGCGGFEFQIRWSGMKSTDNGWIIQHIQRITFAYLCDPKKCACSNKPRDFGDQAKYINDEYYEAWRVVNGKIYVGMEENPSDRFFQSTIGGCGSTFVLGWAKFIPNYKLSRPPWFIGYPPAGDAPVLKPPKKPKGWTDYDALNHMLTANWDCCTKPPFKTTVHSIP